LIRICSLFVIITGVVISPIVSTNFYAYAVQAIWRDYEDMKELVKDIRNGNKDDDNMDWDKFRDSNVYKNENEDIRDCIDLANKVGGKLGDYEIVRCFDNANYYKAKYTGEKGIKNEQNVSKLQEVNQSQSQQQEVNQSQNEKDTSKQQQEVNQSQSKLQEVNQSQNEKDTSKQQQEVNQSQSKLQEVNQSQNEKDTSKQQQEVNQSQSQNEFDVSQTQNSSDVNSPEGCDSSYPDICISITSAKLSCFDIPYKNFKVLLPDRHEFDSDGDGIGCEG
jgi:DNA polymerase III gamma/tau subunit